MSQKYWLLKAEPDSRIVKGKDVKFSVDDLEAQKTSPWEGVRNYEARNLMQAMKVGDKALFYHSNCKNPGIAAFAEVSKEAYPDHTAWDESHPYFDPKSKQSDPKWYMVDLTFVSRAANFIPLNLLKLLINTPSLPTEIEYVGEEGFKALKDMELVTRGRLSVQRVEPGAWDAITKLAEKGGWDALLTKKPTKTKPKAKGGSKGKAGVDGPSSPTRPKRSAGAAVTKGKRKAYAEDEEEDELLSGSEFDGGDGDDYTDEDAGSDYGKPSRAKAKVAAGHRGRKRKAASDDDGDDGEWGSRARKTRAK